MNEVKVICLVRFVVGATVNRKERGVVVKVSHIAGATLDTPCYSGSVLQLCQPIIAGCISNLYGNRLTRYWVGGKIPNHYIAVRVGPIRRRWWEQYISIVGNTDWFPPSILYCLKRGHVVLYTRYRFSMVCVLHIKLQFMFYRFICFRAAVWYFVYLLVPRCMVCLDLGWAAARTCNGITAPTKETRAGQRGNPARSGW